MTGQETTNAQATPDSGPATAAPGPLRPQDQLVTIFGGSGFLGRHVVRALAKRGYRIRVAVRRPDLALFLQPLGKVNQIVAVQANLRYPDSVTRAAERSDVLINLVGILQETGSQSFARLQVEGADAIARAAARQGARMIQVSAIGADPASPSLYARTKAEGETRVFSACPDAVVFRPSLIFGPGDGFFNRFASLARALPVLPLAGGQSRFQPAFVGDVAEAIARAVDGTVAGGKVYELGGPEVGTLEHFVRYMLKTIRRKRPVVDLPLPAAKLQARLLEIADTLTFGLLPDTLKLTRDQVVLLQNDNIVSEAAKAEGRTFEGLGIIPTAAEAVVPGYLWTFRKAGQFATDRDEEVLSEVPDMLAPKPMADGSQHRPKTASGPAIGADAGGSPGTVQGGMGVRWGTRTQR
ncbi:complex I NDUFA9 subunit family protein [Methylobacterium mesophilicum SR1.6/6]|uniref:Complex I NDUFA9 subunit family protein n=1 Tax=Methylobacterium mesophilicum SR1.6/6 TaxID=908290 RepID=A0A6B9FV42_9HYPH|nr:complex I NDUFA9 subunit family protein [Methylobacterium mesophilicum]QGY04804.1 complex I NDUFA9 subunit family protein [Methylobacterium mesophilicum SR1.6/6]